jgi:hypothetical protein
MTILRVQNPISILSTKVVVSMKRMFHPLTRSARSVAEIFPPTGSTRDFTVGMRTLAVVLTIGLFAFTPSVGLGAVDDIVPAKQEVAVEDQMFQMDEANFDANVFQPSGNADQARIQMETKLKLQLNELNRVCELSDAQSHKLKLAATVDIKRFFGAVAVIRKKVKAGKINQQEWQEIWQEIQPLRTRQQAGLFGDSSFFAKSIRKTLNPEQLVKYEVLVNERRRFRYRASISVAIVNLQNTVPMRRAQQQAIIKMLLEETQPPPVFGQYDQYLVMYQMARLPEEKFKPLFDEEQWKQLQVQFNQYRGMDQFLIQNGLIPKENGDDGPAAEAETPENANGGEKRVIRAVRLNFAIPIAVPAEAKNSEDLAVDPDSEPNNERD